MICRGFCLDPGPDPGKKNQCGPKHCFPDPIRQKLKAKFDDGVRPINLPTTGKETKKNVSLKWKTSRVRPSLATMEGEGIKK
jgi:hypothetical protein